MTISSQHMYDMQVCQEKLFAQRISHHGRNYYLVDLRLLYHCCWHIVICFKKTVSLIFVNNFGKFDQIFKIFSPTDSQGYSLCNYCEVFYLTLTVLLPCEMQKSNINNG